MDFSDGSDGKESACNAGDPGSILGSGSSSAEGNGDPLQFLPGEFHGQRSLAGYSPQYSKELDMAEWLHNLLVESESCSVVSDSLQPHELPGILQARILEWVAFPFSRGSSQPRDWTQVYCIADRFFIERRLLLGRKAFNMINLDSNSKAEPALCPQRPI